MQNIGVFFGSRAAEHDVSIISGLQILENADKAKYNVFPVYVSRKGEWFVGEPLKNVETYKNFDENMKGLTKVYLPPAWAAFMQMRAAFSPRRSSYAPWIAQYWHSMA